MEENQQEMNGSPQHGHVLIIPMCFHGHVAPSFRLAIQLAIRGLTVTFVGFNHEISRVRSLYTHTELETLDLHLVDLHPEDSEAFRPNKFQRYQPNMMAGANLMKKALEPFLQDLIADRKAGRPGPNLLIADMFLLWAEDVALRLEIPRCVFIPSGAIFARLLQASPGLYEDGSMERSKEENVNIVGLPSMRLDELPFAMHAAAPYFKSMGQSFVGAAWVVVNTFYELEPEPIDAIRKIWSEDLQKKDRKLFAVGPVESIGNFTDISFVPEQDQGITECVKWLDGHPPQSVLYIAFGTQIYLPANHVHALAQALLSTGKRFLWVLAVDQSSTTLEDALPSNFQSLTRERGRVLTGWVSQVGVLAHPSISSFLSHCGWSSTLEAITFGVPILGWPMKAEQNMNCRYIVDVLKVGIEIKNGENDSKGPQEIETSVRRMMDGQEGRDTRHRLKEYREKVAKAVALGGSSHTAINELTNDVRTLRSLI